MTASGIPNDFALSTTCFGARLGNIQDQIFAAVGMGFRRIELGLAESPATMDGLEDSRRETGVSIGSLVAGCRDALNGSLAVTRLASPDAEERECAINSVRRHVRLAQAWSCPTVVVRGSKLADPKMSRQAHELQSRMDQNGEDFAEEVREFVNKAQSCGQRQAEHLCRSLHALQGEFPETRFALEPGMDIDDLLGFEAMGWVLDDLEGLGYWHDVGRIHARERLGLPGQGEWLDSYGKRMLGVHLQDAAGEETEMPIGLGEVDFQLLKEYVPENAEKVVEINPRHGRAEILTSVQYLVDHGF